MTIPTMALTSSCDTNYRPILTEEQSTLCAQYLLTDAKLVKFYKMIDNSYLQSHSAFPMYLTNFSRLIHSVPHLKDVNCYDYTNFEEIFRNTLLVHNLTNVPSSFKNQNAILPGAIIFSNSRIEMTTIWINRQKQTFEILKIGNYQLSLFVDFIANAKQPTPTFDFGHYFTFHQSSNLVQDIHHVISRTLPTRDYAPNFTMFQTYYVPRFDTNLSEEIRLKTRMALAYLTHSNNVFEELNEPLLNKIHARHSPHFRQMQSICRIQYDPIIASEFNFTLLMRINVDYHFSTINARKPLTYRSSKYALYENISIEPTQKILPDHLPEEIEESIFYQVIDDLIPAQCQCSLLSSINNHDSLSNPLLFPQKCAITQRRTDDFIINLQGLMIIPTNWTFRRTHTIQPIVSTFGQPLPLTWLDVSHLNVKGTPEHAMLTRRQMQQQRNNWTSDIQRAHDAFNIARMQVRTFRQPRFSHQCTNDPHSLEVIRDGYIAPI